MIEEKDYASFYWLKLELTEDEFKSFVSNVEKVGVIDGIDEETQEVCIKFANTKPRTKDQLKLAKQINTKNLKSFLHQLSKHIHGKLYFNVNRNIIKHK